MAVCESTSSGSSVAGIAQLKERAKGIVHGSGKSILPTEILKRLTSNFVAGSGLFAHPDAVCNLLAGVGLKSRGWRIDEPPRGYCDTESSAVGVGQTELPSIDQNLIEYRVQGYKQRVEEIHLELALNNSVLVKAAKQHYVKAAESLFKGFNVLVPAGLSNAIERESEFRVQQPYGNVYLWVKRVVSPDARDKGRELTFVDLELRDRGAELSARTAYNGLVPIFETNS